MFGISRMSTNRFDPIGSKNKRTKKQKPSGNTSNINAKNTFYFNCVGAATQPTKAADYLPLSPLPSPVFVFSVQGKRSHFPNIITVTKDISGEISPRRDGATGAYLWALLCAKIPHFEMKGIQSSGAVQKVEVAVLCPPSLLVLMVSVDVTQH